MLIIILIMGISDACSLYVKTYNRFRHIQQYIQPYINDIIAHHTRTHTHMHTHTHTHAHTHTRTHAHAHTHTHTHTHKLESLMTLQTKRRTR